MKPLIVVSLAAAVLIPGTAHAQWTRDESSVAWMHDTATVWKFSFDTKGGKPFFHPVTVANGPSLTNFKPADHPWHYGLWFSWKYINHVNYWEESRTTGQAAGSTRWSKPDITTRPDGSAIIKMNLTYANDSGGVSTVDMSEEREIRVSAPAKDGSYNIDWTMHFTAGKNGAILDRTAMPGEPKGQVNGGYAGLSARVAALPYIMSVMTTEGAVTEYASDRARPNAAAVAGNFSLDGKDVGSLAILSDAANIGEKAPWYIINTATDFRFLCAAILAPQIRTLAPGGMWDLKYRVALRKNAWTQKDLNDALANWTRKK
jgi:hypothetical protein